MATAPPAPAAAAAPTVPPAPAAAAAPTAPTAPTAPPAPAAAPPAPGAPSVPPGPAPETEHCDPTKASMLVSHLNDARIWVNDAEPKISAFAAGTASPSVSRIVSKALTANFHTTSPADVAVIATNFRRLKAALGEKFNYECASASACTSARAEYVTLAYVRGAFAFVRRLFDINVCPDWFDCSNYFKRVTALIHERAHQYPGADDRSYEFEPTYATISVSDAIDNADSYAVAARQIYHGGGHGPGESCW